MEKKSVINVLYGLRSVDLYNRMRDLMSRLYRDHDIDIVKMDERLFQFETPNVVVRFINSPGKLVGLSADEVFGVGGEIRYRCRKHHNTEPYNGTILDYILEIEKSAAKEGVDIHGV